MFICKECLEKNFLNEEDIRKSRGKCEVCEKIRDCNDIPSKWLVKKEKAGSNIAVIIK